LASQPAASTRCTHLVEQVQLLLERAHILLPRRPLAPQGLYRRQGRLVLLEGALQLALRGFLGAGKGSGAGCQPGALSLQLLVRRRRSGLKAAKACKGALQLRAPVIAAPGIRGNRDDQLVLDPLVFCLPGCYLTERLLLLRCGGTATAGS
jgi:hypothetical protein